MKKSPAERLLKWHRFPFLSLKPSRFFRYWYVLIDDPKMPPAFTTGVFDISLVVNQYHMRNRPEWFMKFVVDHEVEHMRGRHGLWSLLCFLFLPPLWPFVRQLQERLGDIAGARNLKPVHVREACRLLHRKGPRHRFLYGTAKQRADRLIDPRVPRPATSARPRTA